MGTTSRARGRTIALVLTAAAVGAAPAPASAASSWRCEAAAVSGSVLGGLVPLPTVRANPGAVGCDNHTAGAGLSLPSPLDASALVAQTAVSGAAGKPAEQKVVAVGGIANLKLKTLPDLPVALPQVTVPDSLRTLSVSLPAVPNPLPLLPPLLPAQTITVDVQGAVAALAPQRLLPSLDLVSVRGAVAYASAECVNGVPKLAGASQVAGINVLGQELPTGQVVDKVASLLSGGSIDPSDVSLAGISLPGGLTLTDPVLGPVIRAALQNALDALPEITIPEALAQIKVTPGEQTTANGLLTQRALRVQVGIAGRSIADVTVGEASAGAGDVVCGVEPPALECTKKRLVLVDVYERKGRVQLLGAADRKLAGQTVDIVFEGTGKVVAQAKVGLDGAFRTTAALPATSMRSGNDARYKAVLGKDQSLNLKLERRMLVEDMVAKEGRVLITGRVTGPLALSKQERTILVTRRVSCTKQEVVGRFRPDADGRFSIDVAAPAGESTGVYRLSSRVRKSTSNAKTFPTYTLPRAVNLLGR